MRLPCPYGDPDDDTIVYDYSYTFDDVGNRLTYTDEVTETTTEYTYNSMNQMLTAGNISFGYDDNGNMLTKTVNNQTTTQTWDCFGKLLKLTNPDDSVGHRPAVLRRARRHPLLVSISAADDPVPFDPHLDCRTDHRRRHLGDVWRQQRRVV
jgi:YD repeat-containing protein